MEQETDSGVLLADQFGRWTDCGAIERGAVLLYNGYSYSGDSRLGAMVKTITLLLKTARPRQWIKNLTLYAGLIFTGNLFTVDVWWRDFWIVTEAVVVFTIVAVAIYFLNDLLDVSADQMHPFKRKRPMASGELPIPVGWVVFGIGTSLGLYLAI